MAKTTFTEKEMAHELKARVEAKGIDIAIDKVDTILDEFENIVKEKVSAGEDVKMRHFGTFTHVKFQARNRYNPATKQTEQFPAVTKPKFEPSEEFQKQVAEAIPAE